LTDAEKRNRDLIEQVHATLLARIADVRDLSRPVRRRSHYPTVMALLNAVHKLQLAGEETRTLAENLRQELEEIREHGRRVRLSRE
jgi:C4-dicarboxylate-specific signal transduction histidine kinase